MSGLKKLQVEADENFTAIRDRKFSHDSRKVLSKEKVIDNARFTCKNSGLDIDDDSVEVNKIVEIGSEKSRSITHYGITNKGNSKMGIAEFGIVNYTHER